MGSRDFGAATKLTDMGLTSISSVQLMVALEKKFGYSPNVSELQGGMRILDIENALVRRWRKGSPAQAQPEETGTVLSAPLTQTQLGIYLECRMDETSDKYSIPFLLKVGHDTDEKRLADAIRAAVEAHPAMKSSIEPSKNGGAEMIAHPDLPWDIAMETSALEDSALEKELSQEKIIFKLSRAPLFRFRIVKSKTSLYLSMIFHHILMDGTSAAVLLEDIERAYQGEKLQKESYDSLRLGLDENELRKTDALKLSDDIGEARGLFSEEATPVQKIGYRELTGLIAKLPPDARTIFNMFVIEGYSHKEIAQTLGLNEATTRSKLQRARIRLQEMIKGFEK